MPLRTFFLLLCGMNPGEVPVYVKIRDSFEGAMDLWTDSTTTTSTTILNEKGFRILYKKEGGSGGQAE